MRAQLRTAARRLSRFMTDPQLPVPAGAPLIESLSPTRNLTMTIHQGFTSIDWAPLVGQVSRQPQRVAGLIGAPPDADALNRPDSVIDRASVSFQAA